MFTSRCSQRGYMGYNIFKITKSVPEKPKEGLGDAVNGLTAQPVLSARLFEVFAAFKRFEVEVKHIRVFCGNNFRKLPVERVKRLRHCKLHLRLFNGFIVTHAVSFEKKNRSCRFDGKRPDSSRLQKRRAIRHRRV